MSVEREARFLARCGFRPNLQVLAAPVVRPASLQSTWLSNRLGAAERWSTARSHCMSIDAWNFAKRKPSKSRLYGIEEGDPRTSHG